MKKLSFTRYVFVLVFVAACTTSKQISIAPQHADNIANAKIFMAAYQQKAAEYRALCYQAYNIAKLRVDEKIDQQTPKPKAIMTDIDETILDNSAYQVHQSLQGKDYEPASWYDWTARADADTVPGAVHFLQYAASRGIEIFYVTNRDERERTVTLENLKKFGFPFANSEHLMLKSSSSSKSGRRDSIAAIRTIIMFVGDNLNDMNGVFEKKLPDQRMKVTDDNSSAFGDTYIVIPNPSYGDWENALYHYNYSLTPVQKDSVLRGVLKNY